MNNIPVLIEFDGIHYSVYSYYNGKRSNMLGYFGTYSQAADLCIEQGYNIVKYVTSLESHLN